ncbi:MAG: NAD(P)-binding protein [Eubacterium sp.]|nr:NAD(P)-binding protein [Eubacterium sp.]
MINYNNYDLIVVGAGITGATAAYIASHEYRLKVLVLEKKDLGGLLSDYIDHDTGMLVQSYGTHFIHTNNKHIYDFLSQIVPMIPFTLNSRTIVDQMEVQMPFNLQVVDALYDKEKAEEIKLKIMKIFQFEEFIPLTDMLRCRDADIASFAEKLVREHYIPLYKKSMDSKEK